VRSKVRSWYTVEGNQYTGMAAGSTILTFSLR
jgi:hypothetical protein